MMLKRMLLVLMALLVSGVAFADGDAALKIRVAKPGATVVVDRVIKEGQVVVSVEADKNPLLGLSAVDFSITQSGRTAKVTSVQPISESLEVPRHIVMVLDNSYSMYDRKAISALLSGVKEMLKIVRPIDDVLMVVFENNKTIKVGDRDLHVRTLRSNNREELQAFAIESYQTAGLTGGTVLYEALLAGLDGINKMPADEPRFLVVFSDGEDLNSVVKSEVVFNEVKDVKRFSLFAIDYLEGPAPGKFLSKFASQNNGQVFKAKSETNLVPIFQSVASKMEYYYVVGYQFPVAGKLVASPASLTIDEVRTMGAASGTFARISSTELILSPVVDSAYGIASWKARVSNSAGTVSELAGEGAPASALKIPLASADLRALAANGDLAVRMEVLDNKGQKLDLTATPVKVRSVLTQANLAVAPAGVTIEEIKTIDASPMLGHIYFDKDAGEIAPRYVRFSGAAEAAGFDEQKYTTTLDKYYQDLNIVGKRLTNKPEATITLVGCNDNSGKEKGNKKLSTKRAEAVRDYLKTIWNIAPERMTIQARNLPAKPSSIRLKEGQEENRRVEIVSADPAILAPIRSTYQTTRIDAPGITLKPEVVAPNGIAEWKLTASNASGKLAEMAGQGAPARELSVPLASRDLRALALGGDITMKMELLDKAGQSMLLEPAPVKVTFIQTSQRLAQKQDLLIQEKYALILFDFDKDTIEAQNKEIVNKIVDRIKTLPQAKVEIVGHTDNIGKEKYNLKLSERRALAVNKMLLAAYGEAPGERVRYSGVGPNSPLFDNLSPEARSFNRTVTITLEYLSAE